MTYPDPPDSLLDVEEETLRRWQDEDLFRKTLELNEGQERFVFYEGPPTANGRPGLHHILSRTIKDLVCRHRRRLIPKVRRPMAMKTRSIALRDEAHSP